VLAGTHLGGNMFRFSDWRCSGAARLTLRAGITGPDRAAFRPLDAACVTNLPIPFGSAHACCPPMAPVTRNASLKADSVA